MISVIQRALTIVCLGLAAVIGAPAWAATEKPECIAPAKPGGGFDLTCKLAQLGLQDGKLIKDPMRVTYMPGGIGAVAYNAIIAQRPAEGNTIVAFSGGSLLNLAQGKFGKYGENDVRWLAAIGADYGMIAVRADSPYKTLTEVVDALKKDPAKVVFGGGGSVGSQDWLKAAAVTRAAGVGHKNFRYVAFEGGGETSTALLGGHIQVYSGDASEAVTLVEAGKIRVVAVLAENRLPGALKDAPTAKEQGFNVTWPIIRGFYMGPQVSDADFQYWVGVFKKLLASPDFAKQRTERGLFPFDKTGADVESYVKAAVGEYKTLATEFGLVK